MKDLQLFADYVSVLKENDFKVYTSCTDPKPSWAYFVKDDKIGYVQCAYFGGLSFSTVHKPCKECGTGFGLDEEGIYAPNVEDALRTFVIAPKWAKERDRQAVVKYSNWNELNNGRILTYTEL